MRKIAVTLLVCMTSLATMDQVLKNQGYTRIAGGKSAEGKGLMVLYANKAGEWKELAVTPKVACQVDSGTGFVSFIPQGDGA